MIILEHLLPLLCAAKARAKLNLANATVKIITKLHFVFILIWKKIRTNAKVTLITPFGKLLLNK